jgi:hypothetical protein
MGVGAWRHGWILISTGPGGGWERGGSWRTRSAGARPKRLQAERRLAAAPQGCFRHPRPLTWQASVRKRSGCSQYSYKE